MKCMGKRDAADPSKFSVVFGDRLCAFLHRKKRDRCVWFIWHARIENCSSSNKQNSILAKIHSFRCDSPVRTDANGMKEKRIMANGWRKFHITLLIVETKPRGESKRRAEKNPYLLSCPFNSHSQATESLNTMSHSLLLLFVNKKCYSIASGTLETDVFSGIWLLFLTHRSNGPLRAATGGLQRRLITVIRLGLLKWEFWFPEQRRKLHSRWLLITCALVAIDRSTYRAHWQNI